LFDILESDSFWLSGLRFSNDSSEEKILGNDWLKEKNYHHDNFVLCLSDKPDLLSQWRGYCPNGGASIGMDNERVYEYNILYNDAAPSWKSVIVDGTAVSVLYLFAGESSDSYNPDNHYTENDSQLIAWELMKEIKIILGLDKGSGSPQYSLLEEKDFVPFIKHSAFHEESEHRIVISNIDGELAKCIRFRKLPNGTKIPYIILKSWCADISPLPFHISKRSLKKTASYLGNTVTPVLLPVCPNQDELFFAMRKYIKAETGSGKAIKPVICGGHLPIRSIQIAPMPDQKRIVEQVKRFCQSKYWLTDVDVSASNIPYVPSINS
jgi:hypothetical protein